jgi:hypothetical protein
VFCLELVGNELVGRGPSVDTRFGIYPSGIVLVSENRGNVNFKRVGTYRMHKAVDREGVSASDVRLRNECMQGWFASSPLSEVLIR